MRKLTKGGLKLMSFRSKRRCDVLLKQLNDATQSTKFRRNMDMTADTDTPSSSNQTFQLQRTHINALGTEFKVVYAEAGPPSGAVVVGIHGAPCTHNAFRGMVVPLVAAGYRVIIPNLPGNGITEVAKNKVYNYSTPHKAALITGLIQSLQIKRIAMVFAHSLGCHVAAHIACNPPRECAIQSLGLICSPGSTPHRIMSPQIVHKIITTVFYWILQVPFIGSIFARVLSPIFGAAGFRGRTPLAEALGYYEGAHMDFQQFGRDSLAITRRRCPTLILSSSNDKVVQYSITEQTISTLGIRLEDIKWYHKGQSETQVAMRGSDLSRAVVFDDGSHFVMNKYPETLAAEIISFLQTLL